MDKETEERYNKELEKISSRVVNNLDNINKILRDAKQRLELLNDDSTGRLKEMAQKEISTTYNDGNINLEDRLTADDVDFLFNRIGNKPKPKKKTTATNNLKSMMMDTQLFGSNPDLTDLSNTKYVKAEVETVLSSLTALKAKLDKIRIHQIEKVDFEEHEKNNLMELSRLKDKINAIDEIHQELQKWIDAKPNDDEENNDLVTAEMNSYLEAINKLISNITFIKKNENITEAASDLNVLHDPMYFVDFMDEINENIRKKKPF